MISTKLEGKNTTIRDGTLVQVIEVGKKYAYCVAVFDPTCLLSDKIKILQVCRKTQSVLSVLFRIPKEAKKKRYYKFCEK